MTLNLSLSQFFSKTGHIIETHILKDGHKSGDATLQARKYRICFNIGVLKESSNRKAINSYTASITRISLAQTISVQE